MPKPLTAQTLGEALHLSRFRSGITTLDMARRLRVAPNTIRNWEADRTTPGYLFVIAWADACNVEPDELDPDIRNRCSDPAAGDGLAS